MSTTGRASFGQSGRDSGWRAELRRPLAVRAARTLGEVADVVDWVDAESRGGRWGALLLTYEAAPAFDAALRVRESDGPVPMAWAATYAENLAGETMPAGDAAAPLSRVAWIPAIDRVRFTADLARILAHIRAGDTYQVNYTFPVVADFEPDPWAWYRSAVEQAAVPFPACVDIGEAVVISLSPELFLERRGATVTTRPMKGTARRGRWLAEDQRLARDLRSDAKARAENVMIVDLLRNDLGRLAETGSVGVRDLCRLERYPTVWQLTSTIDATIPPSTTLHDLLAATFPCGSVTGAPKVRTMGLIADLEAAARGLYTGAICLLQPGGDLTASVPIRTVVVDRRTGRATFGVGAGITADSVAADEWAECLAKARVVRPPAVPADARLFETLRLEDGVCLRAERHLSRLADSATLFGWPVETATLRAALDRLGQRYPAGTWRARLFLDRHGDVRAEAVAFDATRQVWRVGLARDPVDVRTPLIFNKTTSRDVYEAALAGRADVDDVLLWNARGELTESTRANLVVDIEGIRVTPPVACGLLPGVLRGDLVQRGVLVERVVRRADLARASRLWLINSLRGWIDVELVED